MRKLGTTASPCPGGRHAQPQHLTRPLRLAGLRVLRPLLPQRLRRSSPGRRRPGLVPDQGPRPRYPRYEVLGEMSRRFVAAVEKLAADQQIPLIEFERGQRKEDIAAPLFEKARLADREGVVLIGWAQERVNVFSPPNATRPAPRLSTSTSGTGTGARPISGSAPTPLSPCASTSTVRCG